MKVEQGHDTVGYPSVRASDDGGNADGGHYSPSQVYNNTTNTLPPRTMEVEDSFIFLKNV